MNHEVEKLLFFSVFMVINSLRFLTTFINVWDFTSVTSAPGDRYGINKRCGKRKTKIGRTSLFVEHKATESAL